MDDGNSSSKAGRDLNDWSDLTSSPFLSDYEHTPTISSDFGRWRFRFFCYGFLRGALRLCGSEPECGRCSGSWCGCSCWRGDWKSKWPTAGGCGDWRGDRGGGWVSSGECAGSGGLWAATTLLRQRAGGLPTVLSTCTCDRATALYFDRDRLRLGWGLGRRLGWRLGRASLRTTTLLVIAKRNREDR